jgi:DNA-directed RNA polymerase subunit beta
MARLDPAESFAILKDRVREAISDSFPQEGEKNILEIKSVDIDDKIDIDNVTEQKKAKLAGRTWGVPVKATLVLKDKATGKVIEEKTQKIATLPKITNRYSWIQGGSEFQVDNQWRLKPGVYTKVRQNGELQSFFNVKGTPMHVDFDPKTRIFKTRRLGVNPPLYPIMKALGVDDAELEKTWGKDILAANKVTANGKPINVDRIITNFAKKMVYPGTEIKDPAEAAAIIKQNFKESKLDPDVTERTLGKRISKIDGDSILRSSSRLLGVARGSEKPDVRDSLMYKDFLSTEDFISDRIKEGKPSISRRIKNNLDRRESIGDIVGLDVFQAPISNFFTKTSLVAPAGQTNPLKIVASQLRTTIAGEGGVKDANRITEDAKLVDPSSFAVLDSLETPENGKCGVNLQLTLGARKAGTRVLIPLINKKTNKVEYLGPTEINDSIVALPDSVKKVNGKFAPKKGSKVKASDVGNEIRDVPIEKVQYVIPKSNQMFSVATNMVPFMSSDSPNRATMAGRHMEQAISLKNREAPLVQSMLGKQSFDDIVGKFASQQSSVDGKVVSIDKDTITIKDGANKKHKVSVYNNYPLNDKKGFMDSTPLVAVGDTVKKGQTIADTNFTKNGSYAPGVNLNVAYTPWKGFNFEDGVVISEEAAKKLTSVHMQKKTLSTKDIEVNSKKKYQAYYPDRMNKEQAAKLDDGGVVKVGQKVKPGDTLIAGLAERALTTEEQKMKLLYKSLVKPYKDKALTWEDDYEGDVVDVIKQGKRVEVHIKTEEPMQIGDKLSNRHGGKGIVTRILSEGEMPKTKDGKALEVLVNPIGVPGRMNVGQVCENAAGKVAAKRGTPFQVRNFELEDNVSHVAAELKKEGLTDKEDIIDPKTGKAIPNVQVGQQYVIKLEHQVGKKMSARDRDSYDRNLVPQGGGKHGGQALGALGVYALLAHGAKANLREFQTLKSDKSQGGDNDELWGALQAGEPLPPPKTTFSYKKFNSYLKGMGVNTEKDGNSLNLVPLTDKQTLELSNGELKDAGKVIRMRTLQPERGGLFDEKITGGHSGDKWSHISLNKPVPNPLFEKAVMSLANIRGPQFSRLLNGEDGVTEDGEIVSNKERKPGTVYGPSSIGVLLDKADVRKDLASEEGRIKGLKGQLQSESRRKIKYLRALDKLNMKPREAYMTQKVPILPPNIRPIAVLDDGSIQTDDLNELYKNLAVVNKKVKEFPAGTPASIKAPIEADIYDHLKSLTGLGGSLNKKHPGLLDVIAGKEGPKCYDGDTEVLTSDGWVKFSEYDGETKLATVNLKSKEVEWHVPTDFTVHVDYRGAMHSIKQKEFCDINLFVTDNHKHVVRFRTGLNTGVNGCRTTIGDWFLSTLSATKQIAQRLAEIVNTKFFYCQFMVYDSVYSKLTCVDIKPDNIETKNFVGNVYGPTVNNGTVIVRRHGSTPVVSGNSGFAQGVLIKRKTDLSARSTIVPEPALSLDEIELPRKAAKEAYKPFIVKELRRTMGASPLAAKKMIESDDILAKKALDRVVADRPVLLKRDPVLHKYGIQAFKPRLTDGKAIKIHPLVCSSYNADFDGDMQINSVIAVIPDIYYRKNRSFWDFRRCTMSARFKEDVCYIDDMGHFVSCDLADFPHLEDHVSQNGIDYHKVPPGIKVVTTNGKGRPVLAEVSGWSKHYDKKVEIITLGSKRQIITDDDERAIFGIDCESLEWRRKRPKDCKYHLVPVLTEAPLVPLKEEIKEIKLPEDDALKSHVTLDEHFGYFLGAIITSYWPNYHVDTGDLEFACPCNTIAEKWKKCAQRLFHDEMSLSDMKCVMGKGKKFGWACSMSNKSLSNFILELTDYRNWESKHLPAFFSKAPTSFLEGLLSGIWDMRGDVEHRGSRNTTKIYFTYSSTSLRLIREIQYLLRLLGVPATSYLRQRVKSDDYWKVRISPTEFFEASGLNLKLVNPKKKSLVEAFLNSGPSKGFTYNFYKFKLVPLPYELTVMLKYSLNQSSADKGEIVKLFDALSRGRRRRYITKEVASRIIKIVDSCEHPLFERWRNLVLMPSVHFEKIIEHEITDAEEDGYDLTVPGYETFMSVDGVILSNTMSAYVPMMEDAVDEARKMFPSRNLFSPATHKVMYQPSHEAQVGLFMMAEVDKKTNLKFKSTKELEQAVKDGKLKVNDVAKVGDTSTTLGRLQLDATLPESLQGGTLLKDLKYRFTKGEQSKLFQKAAKADKKAYPYMANKLKDLGNDAVTATGFSFGLEDFKVHKEVRDPLLDKAAKKTAHLNLKKEKDAEKFIDTYEKVMSDIDVELKKKINDPKEKSNLAKLEIAAGIKGRGYRQLTAAPILFVDGKGEVVTSPVEKSYSEGLDSAAYWAATSGGRKGAIQKVQSVSAPGYMTKLMMNSTMDTLISENDCGTERGINLSIDEPDMIGRYTVAEVKLQKGSIPAGTEITPDLVDRMKNSKVSKAVVRSPMRCNHEKGVCQLCAGIGEEGQLYDLGTNLGVQAAQALGERGTQLAMQSFHCNHLKSLVFCRIDGSEFCMSMESLFNYFNSIEFDNINQDNRVVYEDREERIEINEEVPTLEVWDGSWTRVKAIRRHTPDRPMVLVSDKSFSTICQDNHPIATVINDDTHFVPPTKLVRKESLLVRDVSWIPKGSKDKDLPMHPYFAGLYVAEGCICYRWTNPNNKIKKPYSIIISLNNGPIKDKLLEFIPKNLNPKVCSKKIEIHRLKLGHLFEDLFGRYSRNVSLPPDFIHYSDEWLSVFLSGLIDGDGTIKPHNNAPSQIYIDTTSYELVQQVSIICARLGIVTNVQPTPWRECSLHQGYRVALRVTEHTKNILSESVKLRDNFKSQFSPAQKPQLKGNTEASRVREIRYTEEFVYDLTTESGQLFVGGLLSHNSGGVYQGREAANKSIASGGLERATSVLTLKQKIKGSATLAQAGGKITSVKQDPAGGLNVMIGNSRSYVPGNRKMLEKVKVGLRVKKGDPLTRGPINPHEMLPLTGVSKVQGHLTKEMHDIYGQYGIRRRHSELMVRAISNVTKIEDPGDNSDYLPGDFATASKVYAWNKKSKGKKPITHKPVLRGVKQIPLDVQTDWMARLNHEHLKSTLVEAAQQGWQSNLHGEHPIPPLIHGAEFGRGTKDAPWSY